MTKDTEALRKMLVPLLKAIEHPDLGLDWTLPWKVVPCDGKPTIASNRGGNLFRGYIATWQEAELIVAVVNALPDILVAITPDTIGSHFGNGGGFDPSAVEPVAWQFDHPTYSRSWDIGPLTDHAKSRGWTETPLYTHPPHPAPVDPVAGGEALREASSSADFHQRRGMLADVILAALHEYDEWMIDDRYDYDVALEKVVAQLERGREIAALKGPAA